MNIKICLKPQCVDDWEQLALVREGTMLGINGAGLDLSFLAEGDTLPAGSIDHPLLHGAEIRCRGDVIEIDALLFQISPACTDPAACFPKPILASEDGPIQLPPQASPVSEPETTDPEEEPHADQH